MAMITGNGIELVVGLIGCPIGPWSVLAAALGMGEISGIEGEGHLRYSGGEAARTAVNQCQHGWC